MQIKSPVSILSGLHRASDVIDAWLNRIGQVAAWMIPLMAVVTGINVLFREGFDFSSSAGIETVLYLHVISLVLAIPYTMQQNQHVRVDFLRSKWSAKTRDLIEIACHLVFMLPFCLVIFFASLDYVGNSWAVMERSQEFDGLGYVYLLKTMIPIGAMLLLLQTLTQLSRLVIRRLSDTPAT